MGDDFRCRIPIYHTEQDTYFTTYDFEQNAIPGQITVYISPDGDNANDGLTPQNPKNTVEGAMECKPNTILAMQGTYTEGVNFKSNTELKDVNLIGFGGVVFDNAGNNPLVVTGSVFIKNISFVNGNFGSLRTYIEDTDSRCTYIGCKFNNSLVDNLNVSKANSLGGLRIQGGTHYLFRCEASNNGFDGFSYHSAPDGNTDNAPHVVEVECSAYCNGINNSYESNNASTAHDGTQIVRLNCHYGSSHGALVADVHERTVSFNVGCSAFSPIDQPMHREYQANYFSATGATMYLLACVSYGANYDVSCFNKGVVLSDRSYPTIYLDNGKVTFLTDDSRI